jgi:DNA-binding LacI/PurR family transcriptional regulator
MSKPNDTLTSPATLRRIAAIAKVSAMTVSRALGNRPRIAAATRDRILRVAAALGYRPDPEINKLMRHLRTLRRPRFQSVICGLSTRAPDAREPYFRAVVAGARQRAEQRGYGFMQLQVSGQRVEWPGVHRVLRARGVQGVLLLPLQEPIDFTGLLEWREFSVVAATSSVLAPAINRVTPNHFVNAVLLCRQLADLGYRRLGLVMEAEHDRRVNHGFDAAFIWHAARESQRPVAPLIVSNVTKSVLTSWYRRERPDAIIATDQRRLARYTKWLGLKAGGRVGLASTNVDEGASLVGIDERPSEIGAVAVDLLANAIEQRERGLPASPSTTLLAGVWRPGRSRSV